MIAGYDMGDLGVYSLLEVFFKKLLLTVGTILPLITYSLSYRYTVFIFLNLWSFM